VYRRVSAYMALRGMDASMVSAGCARCQACSAMGSLQKLVQIPTLQVGS